VVAAGRDALGVNPAYVDFLRALGGRPRPPAPFPGEPATPAESMPVAAIPAVPDVSPASSFATAH
jgi:hypothetical protein